jgi:type IV pilus assembly protein PilA
MNDVRRVGNAGFTLIELLVVIAIIGILAAIAIPQFAAYRRKGYDADIQTNARNMATAQEAYFVDNNTYTSLVADLASFGYSQSANVTPNVPTANGTTFVVTATVISGCGAATGVATYDQATGQIGLVQCAP